MVKPIEDWRHGTASCYNNQGCRCDPCRIAASEQRHRWTKSLATRPASDIPHGTACGYTSWKCRCFKCSLAHAKQHHNRWFACSNVTYFTSDPHYAIKKHDGIYELFVSGVSRKRFTTKNKAQVYVDDGSVRKRVEMTDYSGTCPKCDAPDGSPCTYTNANNIHRDPITGIYVENVIGEPMLLTHYERRQRQTTS